MTTFTNETCAGLPEKGHLVKGIFLVRQMNNSMDAGQ